MTREGVCLRLTLKADRPACNAPLFPAIHVASRTCIKLLHVPQLLINANENCWLQLAVRFRAKPV